MAPKAVKQKGVNVPVATSKKPDKQTKQEEGEQLRNDIVQNSLECGWIHDMEEAPVFRPTTEEFADPIKYIMQIQAKAAPFGICKIVPPVMPAVPGGLVIAHGFKFTTRQQLVGRRDWKDWNSCHFYQMAKRFSLTEYERMANETAKKEFGVAGMLPARMAEASYWREQQKVQNRWVDYGNDVEGTAFSGHPSDPLGASRWNLKVLPREERSTLRHLNGSIPGVTDPMLYIGQLYASFAWHVEDHYLYSINYHHLGAPKTWYGVPADHADGFERVVRDNVYTGAVNRDLAAGLSHQEVHDRALASIIGKTTLVCPKLLIDNDVKVYRAVQQAGEFVVTFPRAYHGGFSNGFNCGEAVNFGTADWLPYGAECAARYRRLRHMPILPHEQLVCSEVAARFGIYFTHKEVAPDDVASQMTLARTFVRLMQHGNEQRYSLHCKGAGHRLMPRTACSQPCGHCRDLCYLAMVYPEEAQDPLCLRCANRSALLSPGSTVMWREVVPGLEELAQHLEPLVRSHAASESPRAPIGLTEAANFGSDRELDGALDAVFAWRDIPGVSAAAAAAAEEEAAVGFHAPAAKHDAGITAVPVPGTAMDLDRAWLDQALWRAAGPAAGTAGTAGHPGQQRRSAPGTASHPQQQRSARLRARVAAPVVAADPQQVGAAAQRPGLAKLEQRQDQASTSSKRRMLDDERPAVVPAIKGRAAGAAPLELLDDERPAVAPAIKGHVAGAAPLKLLGDERPAVVLPSRAVQQVRPPSNC